MTIDLRRIWNNTSRNGGVDVAYQAIATAYAGLGVNKADPHAYNRMLSHLKNGVEKPIDVHPKTGDDHGVIEWIEQRLRQEAKTRQAA